jgi:hypothetical protein
LILSIARIGSSLSNNRPRTATANLEIAISRFCMSHGQFPGHPPLAEVVKAEDNGLYKGGSNATTGNAESLVTVSVTREVGSVCFSGDTEGSRRGTFSGCLVRTVACIPYTQK